MQYEHYRTFGEESSDPDFIGAMSYWLASLYVVLEGWKEIDGSDEVIRLLVESYEDYYQLLRRLRNGVYHFQPTPLSEKLTDFLDKKGEGNAWAYALLFELKRFLVDLVPQDEDGEEVKRMIGWWPNEFLVLVKAARGYKYGEINPGIMFLSRIPANFSQTD